MAALLAKSSFIAAAAEENQNRTSTWESTTLSTISFSIAWKITEWNQVGLSQSIRIIVENIRPIELYSLSKWWEMDHTGRWIRNGTKSNPGWTGEWWKEDWCWNQGRDRQ